MWLIMVSVAWLVGTTIGVPCEEARMRCAYRDGCGRVLQKYIVDCSTVLQGDRFPTNCPEICQYTLIALTSTEEGMELMDCECGDKYCENQKQRTEVCRPAVLHSIHSSVVPCTVAQWICMADTQCSKAFEYYKEYCKAMFHGKKCTARCNNSINILRKQEKAAKLKTCKCDGFEDYDCHGIQRNMDKLCFHKHSKHRNQTHHENKEDETPTVIITSSAFQATISWSFIVLLVSLVT
ncbi:growth arrest-specific protein 1-like [Diorhabda carinulata]|uniref:growth arrest-specific protein 1-like n=1 Tax=Diorhabda sublineata TaxID=1163346 RepID=UPI0024E10E52|nr:growth arrest-specific protein 1-like [Diorhabda sublineata]XP_057669021.1 growth arrest-specific protein 1-like [Diorhabda carinulata]